MSAYIDSSSADDSSPEDSPSSLVCRYPRCQRKRKIETVEELRAHERTHSMKVCPGCDRRDKKHFLEKHFLVVRHVRKQTCYAIEKETLVAYDLYLCDLCDYKNRDSSLVVDHYWSHSNFNDGISENKKVTLRWEKGLPRTAGQSSSKQMPVCGESCTPPSDEPPESSASTKKTNQSNRVVYFTCGFYQCTRKFSCIRTYRQHLESHGVKKEVCPVCTTEFSTQMQLGEHFRIHVKKVSIPIMKPLKGKSAVENLEYYVCPLCNHSGSWIGTLVKHYWKKHVVPGTPVTCAPDVNKEVAGNANLDSDSDPNTAEVRGENEDHSSIDSDDMSVERNGETGKATPSYSSQSKQTGHFVFKFKGTKILYECPVCTMDFSAAHLLEDHFEVHTRKAVSKLLWKDGTTTEEIDYGCEVCRYSSSKLSAILKHYMKRHLSESSSSKSQQPGSGMEKYKKRGEPERFGDSRGSSSPSQKSVTCSSEPAVQIKNEMENTEFEFVSVPNSEDLVEMEEDHVTDPLDISSPSSKVKTFVCYSCGYQTNSRRYLSKHVQTHTVTEGDFLCEICGRKTDSLVSLRRHTSRNHYYYLTTKPGKEYLANTVCCICHYKSSDESTMRAHMLKSHPALTLEKSCESCGSQFDCNAKLICHQAMEKFPFEGGEYVCGVCDYKSPYRCGLESHRKTHKNETFPCNLCEFIGISAASLMIHKKFKHEIPLTR